MKRNRLLPGLLALLVLAVTLWGWLQWRWLERRNWLETANRQALESAVQEHGEDPQVMAKLADRYLQDGEVGRARATAEIAIQRFPQSPEAYRSYGLCMLALRRLPDAEKSLQKSLSLADDVETRLALCRTLTPQQRFPLVIELCAPLIASSPSLAVTPQQRASALVYNAGSRLNGPLTSGELEILQQHLQEAMQPASALPVEERFLADYFLGDSMIRADKPAEAIPFLERSVAENPSFPGTLYSLARAYHLSGEETKSRETFVRHEKLSRLLSELDSLNTRLEQRPDDAETLLRMAGALAESGDVAQAAAIYQRLILAGKFSSLAEKRLKDLSSH